MRRSLALLLLAPVVVLATAGAARADQASPVGGPALAHQGVVASGAEPPQIYARSWVLADATTGEVLAARNAHLQQRPASTLKTLTAITLLPRLDKREVYEVQWEDAAVEGSAVGIVPGATYTVDQLFYGLMLPSGNDAAHALASAAGGMRYTVGLMQAHAEKLQALDTVVRNPSGLDADGQYTSAYDLALFARAGLVRADFRRYVGTVTTAFPGQMPKHEGKKRPTYQIYNQNPLLYDGYRGAVGVKTGYTTLAGRTFVGAAERDGHLLVVSLMGIVESSETAAQRLLDWGFAHRDRIQPVGELVNPVARGELKQTATAPLTTSVPTGAADDAAANGPSSLWAVVSLAAVAAVLALGAFRLRAARRR